MSRRDLSVEVLGLKLRAPVMLAPIGVQGILHEEGELAVARAARARRADDPEHGLVVSDGSGGRGPGRYAALVPALLAPRRRAGRELHSPRRAGRLRRDRGDARHLPARLARARHPERVSAVLSRRRAGQLFQRPGLSAGRRRRSTANPVTAIDYFGQVFSDPSRTWADLGRLCQSTRLPVLVKGVLHPDDARRAVDQGRGRRDRLQPRRTAARRRFAALDALPGVADAVGDRTTVLFDSGIRRGADVFKAIALGARAVLLGRPYAYGLAVAGEHGVRDVLANLIADIDLTLGLAGCASFAEVGAGTWRPDGLVLISGRQVVRFSAFVGVGAGSVRRSVSEVNSKIGQHLVRLHASSCGITRKLSGPARREKPSHPLKPPRRAGSAAARGSAGLSAHD